MPCRSDYMEPTQREINRGNKIVTGLNELADEITYANDVLREYILGERGALLPLKFVNLDGDFERRRKSLKAQATGNYDLANPKALPGLQKHVAGLLRDYVRLNGFVTKNNVMKPEDYRWVVDEQNAHRESDLRRLMKVFAEAGDRQRLKRVLDADNTKPLEPQLGFSPDEF